MRNDTSLWRATVQLPTFRPVPGPLSADVLVIGAGITGLTAAVLLQEAGRQVVVLDALGVGGGETGNTTAHLTELLDARYHTLESRFGREGALLAAESSRAAMDRIEAFAAGPAPGGCGFRRVPGYLYAERPEQLDELERELAALQRVGVEAARVDRVPLPFPVEGAIRIDRQGQIHPLEYLGALLRRLLDSGGQVYQGTRALDVEDGAPCRVETTAGTLTAQAVVVAANVPISNRLALHTKIAPYRTYALAARVDPPRGPALLWDLDDPYHYLRWQETGSGTFLIVGGEDHKVGQLDETGERYARLEAWTGARFPGAQVVHRWSGQIIEPADGLAFIGRNSGSRHVYVATGYSGTGLTFGTLAGMIIADAVTGVPNRWAPLYDATRVKPLAQAGRFAAENLDYPARLARDRVDRGEVATPADIPAGEGRLLRDGGKMLAVYRDGAGALTARSAVCPHLGCYVHWNGAERSWDCPCHGSRFDVEGQVLNGPAVEPLDEVRIGDAPISPGPERA